MIKQVKIHTWIRSSIPFQKMKIGKIPSQVMSNDTQHSTATGHLFRRASGYTKSSWRVTKRYPDNVTLWEKLKYKLVLIKLKVLVRLHFKLYIFINVGNQTSPPRESLALKTNVIHWALKSLITNHFNGDERRKRIQTHMKKHYMKYKLLMASKNILS